MVGPRTQRAWRDKDAIMVRARPDVITRFRHLAVEIGTYERTLEALLDIYEHFARLYNTYDPERLKRVLGVER